MAGDYLRVRITAEPGRVGEIVDLPKPVAAARIAGGTAILVEDPPKPETAAIDPGSKALAPEDKPPKRKSAR